MKGILLFYFFFKEGGIGVEGVGSLLGGIFSLFVFCFLVFTFNTFQIFNGFNLKGEKI